MLFDVCNGAFIRTASVAVLVTSYLQSALCQCSGTTEVYTATETFEVFTSINYPFSYQNNLNCLWRIEAANSTYAIRLEIVDASIEYHADCVYDTGEVFDGYNVSKPSLGRFCGTNNPSYVSTENYLTVTFMSDYSLTSRGFKAQYKSGIRSSLLDKEDETSQLDTVVILGASIGAVVFLVLVMAVVFTYIQAKKAKEIRRNPNMRRGTSTSRVEPFDCDYGTNYWLPPAPPAYGEIYSSPMSPPPDYCEVDPNPHPNAPLSGRTEFMSPPSGQHLVQSSVVNPVYERTRGEQSDHNANTHFIRTSNVIQTSTAMPVITSTLSSTISNIQRSTGISPRRPNQQRAQSRNGNQMANQRNSSNAGAVAAMEILNPSALQTTNINRDTASRNRSRLSIRVPEQTESLPNAIETPSPLTVATNFSTASSRGNNTSNQTSISQSRP